MSDADFEQRVAMIAAGYLSKNEVDVKDIPNVIARIRDALHKESYASPQLPTRAPAVPIEKSLTDDYIICLEDGKKMRTITRHIKKYYGLTPEQYRYRWGLPVTYPMCAPSFSRMRSTNAENNPLLNKRRS